MRWPRFVMRVGLPVAGGLLISAGLWEAAAQTPPVKAQTPPVKASSASPEEIAEICIKAARELDAMRADGIEGLIAKGPEWAKTGATKAEIARIKRFMGLQEQVLFKCPMQLPRPTEEASGPPPLPVRRPAIARSRRAAPPDTAVPLPVRKKSML